MGAVVAAPWGQLDAKPYSSIEPGFDSIVDQRLPPVPVIRRHRWSQGLLAAYCCNQGGSFNLTVVRLPFDKGSLYNLWA